MDPLLIALLGIIFFYIGLQCLNILKYLSKLIKLILNYRYFSKKYPISYTGFNGWNGVERMVCVCIHIYIYDVFSNFVLYGDVDVT
jgi:hypothetical protein